MNAHSAMALHVVNVNIIVGSNLIYSVDTLHYMHIVCVMYMHTSPLEGAK